MIDIVLDGNINNEFCGKEYPSVEINDFKSYTWDEYKNKAKEIIANNLNHLAIIIKITDDKISLNKMALAIFVESFDVNDCLEYAVFKVQDLHKAQEEYKPYVALTIGIKYALVLSNETAKTIYKNISELGYLGIKTKRDYASNTMILSLPNSSEKPQTIEVNSLQDVICGVALFKALSLAQKEVNLEMLVKCDDTKDIINRDEMVKKIISDASTWIN